MKSVEKRKWQKLNYAKGAIFQSHISQMLFAYVSGHRSLHNTINCDLRNVSLSQQSITQGCLTRVSSGGDHLESSEIAVSGHIFYTFTYTSFWSISRMGVAGDSVWCDTRLELNSSWSLQLNDVLMSSLASQITSLTIVYSHVYSRADQRKYQSSAPLAFVWGIHRWPVNSPHKGPVTRKRFPFDDVIMLSRLKRYITTKMIKR